MSDLAKGKKTHSIFEAAEVPWIFRGGETKPDHLDVMALVALAGVDLAATFTRATGRPFDPEANLLVSAKPLRFRAGQLIPLHTHLKDLRQSATVVMLKRVTTPGGVIVYTDGTEDDRDNGYQELSIDQWAVVDARTRYFGKVRAAEGKVPYVEMDLLSVRLVDAQSHPIAIAAGQVVAKTDET